MYIRTTKVGSQRYVRIVEAVRVGGKPTQRLLASLGNVKEFRRHIPTILRGLHRILGDEAAPEFEPDAPPVLLENISHAEYGVTLVVNALWAELGLDRALRQCFRARRPCAPPRRWCAPWSPTASRTPRPSSASPPGSAT